MNYDALCIHCFHEKNSRREPCPYCGFHPENYHPQKNHLRPYTILHGEYLLGEVVGYGGFGIVYRAFDLNLHSMVAIKELFPTGLMTRTCELHSVSGTGSYKTQTSVVYTEKPEYIDAVRNKFVREARILAQLESRQGDEGIVRVHALFSENGTDYMVMEFLEGQTLKDYLKANHRIEWAVLLEMLKPCMKALSLLHSQGIIHRDISPDNIMILDTTGGLKLLDFGNVKINYSDPEFASTKLPAIKRGYSPIEQYSENGHIGPETDIYALCATIYRCTAGVTPPEPAEILQSGLKKPSEYGAIIPDYCEAALIKGLSLKADDRFHSINDLMEVLYEQEDPVISSVNSCEYDREPAEGDGSGIEKEAVKEPEGQDRNVSSVMLLNEGTYSASDQYTNLAEREKALSAADNSLSSETHLSNVESRKENISPFPDFSMIDKLDQSIHITDRNEENPLWQSREMLGRLLWAIVLLLSIVSIFSAWTKSQPEDSRKSQVSEKVIRSENKTDTEETDAKPKNISPQSTVSSSTDSMRETSSPLSEKNKATTEKIVHNETEKQGTIVGNKIVWATARLNVRTGPGTEFERCGQLSENQGAILVGDDEKWKEIVFSVYDAERDEYSTVRGYASSTYLQEDLYFLALDKNLPVESLVSMADNYYYSDDILEHYKKAAKWYLMAAEKGSAYAQYSIGYMYVNGEGVERDDNQAISWLQKAADQKQEGSDAAKVLLDSLQN